MYVYRNIYVLGPRSWNVLDILATLKSKIQGKPLSAKAHQWPQQPRCWTNLLSLEPLPRWVVAPVMGWNDPGNRMWKIGVVIQYRNTPKIKKRKNSGKKPWKDHWFVGYWNWVLLGEYWVFSNSPSSPSGGFNSELNYTVEKTIVSRWFLRGKVLAICVSKPSSF